MLLPFPLSEPSYAAPFPGDTATKSRASAERAKAVTSRERMTGEVGNGQGGGPTGQVLSRWGTDVTTTPRSPRSRRLNCLSLHMFRRGILLGEKRGREGVGLFIHMVQARKVTNRPQECTGFETPNTITHRAEAMIGDVNKRKHELVIDE